MPNNKFNIKMRLPDGTVKTFKNVEYIYHEENLTQIISHKSLDGDNSGLVAEFDRKTGVLYEFSRPIKIKL